MAEPTGHRHEGLPLTPRLRSMVASTIVALAAGTPYVYAAYAPQLVANSKLSTDDAAKLSLALSIGGTIGGFPAGIIIDNFGPGLADLLGSLLAFGSFGGLHKLYVERSKSVHTMMLLLAGSSFASVLCFYSTINCVSANFPHHRGTAGAIPVSAYALASLLYSSISVHFYKNNTSGLIRFISYFSAGGCFLGSFFLVIIYHKKIVDTEGSSGSNDREPLLRRPSTASLYDTIVEGKKSVQNRLSLWGIGRTPSFGNLDASSTARLINNNTNSTTTPTSPKLQRTDTDALYVAVEDVPIFVKYGSPIWNHHIFKNIISRLYIKFYIILASLQGIGQTYIYSVGYLVVTLNDSQPNSNSNSVAKIQALQVSTIAIASFLGRLCSGPISDIVVKRLHAQRVWCIFFAGTLMTFGQFLTRTVNNLDHLVFVSFINGFSFGFIFGSFPAIIADNFGTNGFTTLWGFLTTGAVVVVSLLTKHLGKTLASNSNESGACVSGVACYEKTFKLTQYWAIFITSLILFTIYYNYRLAVHRRHS